MPRPKPFSEYVNVVAATPSSTFAALATVGSAIAVKNAEPMPGSSNCMPPIAAISVAKMAAVLTNDANGGIGFAGNGSM
jgi:hypothetical protein